MFVYSTLTELSDFDTLTSFDTDSSFWVCNNSVTGHICNDKSLFTEELVPSIFDVGSAAGTLHPNLIELYSF
jgi:hypothetical protein